MTPIKAIVFDIGGVLEIGVDGGEPTKPAAELLGRWETRPDVNGAALRDYLRRTNADGATGRCTEDEWVRGLQRAIGADAAQLDAFLRELWDLYLGQANVELTEWLRAQRARYRTALLSNSFIGARAREEERYAFSQLVEQIVYSHEVGLTKPDPAIYALTCDRLGLAPDEVLFLDDNPEYVEGARAFGIPTVQFDHNAQAISEMESLLRGAS